MARMFARYQAVERKVMRFRARGRSGPNAGQFGSILAPTRKEGYVELRRTESRQVLGLGRNAVLFRRRMKPDGKSEALIF